MMRPEPDPPPVSLAPARPIAETGPSKVEASTYVDADRGYEWRDQMELRHQEEELERKRSERRGAEDAQRRFGRYQGWVLCGLGGLVVFSILVVAFGQTWGMSPEFALELMRSTVPVLVGAAAGIVGAFFGGGGTNLR